MAPAEKGFSWSNIAVGATMNLVRCSPCFVIGIL